MKNKKTIIMKTGICTVLFIVLFAATGFSQPANRGSIGGKSRVKIG